MSEEVMCYVARWPDKPGYCALVVIDPLYANDTARDVAEWIREGRIVDRVPLSAGRAGLSAYARHRGAA